MKYSLVFALLLLAAFACRQVLPPSEVALSDEAGHHCQRSDLDKVTWLLGSWQTPDGLLQQEVQMINDSTLSIHSIFLSENRDETRLLQWRNQRFWFGEDRTVAWIGRKSIHMESLKSDVPALTWTRRDDTSWYMILHQTDRPASQILLERMPKMGLIHP